MSPGLTGAAASCNGVLALPLRNSKARGFWGLGLSEVGLSAYRASFEGGLGSRTLLRIFVFFFSFALASETGLLEGSGDFANMLHVGLHVESRTFQAKKVSSDIVLLVLDPHAFTYFPCCFWSSGSPLQVPEESTPWMALVAELGGARPTKTRSGAEGQGECPNTVNIEERVQEFPAKFRLTPISSPAELCNWQG